MSDQEHATGVRWNNFHDHPYRGINKGFDRRYKAEDMYYDNRLFQTRVVSDGPSVVFSVYAHWNDALHDLFDIITEPGFTPPAEPLPRLMLGQHFIMYGIGVMELGAYWDLDTWGYEECVSLVLSEMNGAGDLPDPFVWRMTTVRVGKKKERRILEDHREVVQRLDREGSDQLLEGIDRMLAENEER
jgi:hypothetical protein